MRFMTTPSGNRVSLRNFVKNWKILKSLDPETEVKGWEWYPMKARDILRDISLGVQDRINQAIPYIERK